jgi:glycosyltransferase involved in cell wall biosynthesis
MKKLSIVVPAYNEEEVLPHFYEEVRRGIIKNTR